MLTTVDESLRLAILWIFLTISFATITEQLKATHFKEFVRRRAKRCCDIDGFGGGGGAFGGFGGGGGGGGGGGAAATPTVVVLPISAQPGAAGTAATGPIQVIPIGPTPRVRLINLGTNVGGTGAGNTVPIVDGHGGHQEIILIPATDGYASGPRQLRVINLGESNNAGFGGLGTANAAASGQPQIYVIGGGQTRRQQNYRNRQQDFQQQQQQQNYNNNPMFNMFREMFGFEPPMMFNQQPQQRRQQQQDQTPPIILITQPVAAQPASIPPSWLSVMPPSEAYSYLPPPVQPSNSVLSSVPGLEIHDRYAFPVPATVTETTPTNETTTLDVNVVGG